MAQTCANCETVVFRTRFRGGMWVGIDCGCTAEEIAKSTVNVWDGLVLQHVHGEDGKPLRVSSLRQLREAEKRYHFSHLCANQNEANFNTPKQAAPYKVGDGYKRKFRRS